MSRDYVSLANDALLALLRVEHAVVWLEVEAKLAERPLQTSAGFLPQGINPHHLTAARRSLNAAGLIEELAGPTRGGRSITVIALKDRKGRQRAFKDAAARKRLLHTRFIAWGTALKKRPNMLGTAGERVLHASLLKAAPHGYQLVKPQGGEVATLFGSGVPGGPLDSAAHLQIQDAVGRPVGNVTVLIEVKNIRHWIYPESPELYELLDKAAQLQHLNPNLRFMPVLVCRRAHYTTFKMAKDLGFYIADARAQFVLPGSDLNRDHLMEVRNELGFADLEAKDSDDDRIVRLFERSLREVADQASTKFSLAAQRFGGNFRILRSRGGPPAMERLRAAVAKDGTFGGGW